MITLPRIVHCADVHFGTPFSGISDKSSVRNDDLRGTFSRIIDLTISGRAELLLIAGDLFDSNNVQEETMIFIKTCLNKIPGVRVFICSGNHDYALPGSRYFTEKWPENVHIFTGEMESVFLPDLNTTVYGMGFNMPYLRQNYLKNFEISDNNSVNIALLHGDVLTPGGQSDYNPIPLEFIEKSCLDYIALGHRHSYSGIQRAGNTFYAYSGNPEGRGFDEPGPRGIISGQISKGFSDLSFININKRSYNELTLDISGCQTHDDICSLLFEKCNTSPDFDMSRDLYKVNLTGYPGTGFEPDLRILMSRLENKFFYIKFKNKTTPRVSIESLIKENTLKGIFARRFCEKIEEARKNSDPEMVRMLEKALATGLKAFEGEVNILDN